MEMKTKEVKKVGKSRQKRINLFVYLVQIAVQGAMSVQVMCNYQPLKLNGHERKTLLG